MTEATDLAYVQNKGWTDPAGVIKSYMGAEKLIGRDPSTLITLPRADDPAGFRAVFSKLGMPDTADKYDLPMPKDANPAYATWAKETFHKVGLTAAQAKELTAANNDYYAKAQVAAEADYQRELTTQKATLLGEWKGGYERMMNAAQTAVHALGFTGDMVDMLESKMGYAGVMKFFAGLGQKLGGEDGFETGSGAPGFSGTLTPDEAKAQIAAMKIDPNQTAAMRDNQHPAHKATKQKWTDLHNIAFPG
jgi:hypothetical protein